MHLFTVLLDSRNFFRSLQLVMTIVTPHHIAQALSHSKLIHTHTRNQMLVVLHLKNPLTALILGLIRAVFFCTRNLTSAVGGLCIESRSNRRGEGGLLRAGWRFKSRFDSNADRCRFEFRRAFMVAR